MSSELNREIEKERECIKNTTDKMFYVDCAIIFIGIFVGYMLLVILLYFIA